MDTNPTTGPTNFRRGFIYLLIVALILIFAVISCQKSFPAQNGTSNSNSNNQQTASAKTGDFTENDSAQTDKGGHIIGSALFGDCDLSVQRLTMGIDIFNVSAPKEMKNPEKVLVYYNESLTPVAAFMGEVNGQKITVIDPVMLAAWIQGPLSRTSFCPYHHVVESTWGGIYIEAHPGVNAIFWHKAVRDETVQLSDMITILDERNGINFRSVYEPGASREYDRCYTLARCFWGAVNGLTSPAGDDLLHYQRRNGIPEIHLKYDGDPIPRYEEGQSSMIDPNMGYVCFPVQPDHIHVYAIPLEKQQ